MERVSKPLVWWRNSIVALLQWQKRMENKNQLGLICIWHFSLIVEVEYVVEKLSSEELALRGVGWDGHQTADPEAPPSKPQQSPSQTTDWCMLTMKRPRIPLRQLYQHATLLPWRGSQE